MKINKIKYYKGKLNSFYRRIYHRLFKKGAPYGNVNGKKVIKCPRESNEYISKLILSGKPFMAGRFGSVELSVVNNYYERCISGKTLYEERIKKSICINAGFFPNNEMLLDKFSELMLESSFELDIVGLWNDKMELFTVGEFAPKAQGIELFCLEPYYDIESSWTHALSGKRILVVHPFSETIEKQFLRKEKLFPGEFWPQCTLTTVKAVQTLAGVKDDRFETWFEALDYMKSEIDKKAYDIAIIGCGAYGLPLAAHVKKRGKQAIHLGGATQLLFGIKGSRWEKSELNRFFNDRWVSPGENETPKNKNLVEQGCYW